LRPFLPSWVLESFVPGTCRGTERSQLLECGFLLRPIKPNQTGDLDSKAATGHMTMVRTLVISAMIRQIKASEFKAKCLALMDEVARTGAALVITKNGKPVAELVPHRPPQHNARGILKNELFVTGDIISPLDVEWEALK
jgi:prevent-host-death family protein